MTEARGGGKSGRAMQVVARLHAAPPRHNAGAEWMAWSMFRALVERGHDVTVWLSRYGEDHEPYELDGVKVIPWSRASTSLLPSVGRVSWCRIWRT